MEANAPLPTIPDFLKSAASKHGPLVAIETAAQILTYEDLESESARFARGLISAGVGKASRVCLLMPNTPAWLVAFMAVARLGATVIPISTLYQPRELADIINLVDPDTIICVDKFRNHDYIQKFELAFPGLGNAVGGDIYIPEAPLLRRIFVHGSSDRPWARSWEDVPLLANGSDGSLLEEIERRVTPADVAVMICTSGSTALPKAVMHTHGGFLRHTGLVGSRYWCFGKGDKLASTRPWFWVAGLSGTVFHALHAGAGVAALDSEDPSLVWDLIRDRQLTGVSGSWAFFRAIIGYLEKHDTGFGLVPVAFDCAGVTRKLGGKQRFLSPHLDSLADPDAMPSDWGRFPLLYGMTETLGTHAGEPPPDLIPLEKAGACGRATPDISYSIRDPESGRELSAGEPGELYVRGENVTVGLYKRERQETFTPDGFYATGDMCSLDEDGYLTFHGRRSDMIKVHGANVSPREVEACLVSFPEVMEAVVLGLFPRRSDAYLVAAVVASHSEVDSDGILARLRDLLSSYKVPRRLFVLETDQIPRTGTGKIRKADLISMLESMCQDPSSSAPED